MMAYLLMSWSERMLARTRGSLRAIETLPPGEGRPVLDLVLVALDEPDRLLGFFPGLRGMAEDEEDIGNDVELPAPGDDIVKILDPDLLVDDGVAHPLRPGLHPE